VPGLARDDDHELDEYDDNAHEHNHEYDDDDTVCVVRNVRQLVSAER